MGLTQSTNKQINDKPQIYTDAEIKKMLIIYSLIIKEIQLMHSTRQVIHLQN